MGIEQGRNACLCNSGRCSISGSRLSLGVDDAVLEAIGAGASGWVAGLAIALPVTPWSCSTLESRDKTEER